MGSYREHALEGASAVDLVVALYDGIIRFLYAADRCRRARRRRWPPRRSEARAGHHHSPAGASAHGCGRPRRRRRSASSMPRSLRRFCRPRSRPREQNSSMPSIVCSNVRDAWREVARDPDVNPASSTAMPARNQSPKSTLIRRRSAAQLSRPSCHAWTARARNCAAWQLRQHC